MKLTTFRTAVLVISALVPPVSANATSCQQEGANAPLALHKEWIMKGWERDEGDSAYDFANKLGKFYDLNNTKGVFWDNFAPGDTQLFNDAARYGDNWKSLQDAARSVRHGIRDGDALVGDDVASTTLGFVGRLERLTGEVIAFDARSQLAWTCVDGAWKIRHEINYAWVVEPKSIEPVLGQK
ncbi:hypothetical protein IFT84_11170 [Rhizobium sp. CFBP 8762]|uniref:hypothetical protein n=1 Tax=Rhizobium sp. CFBP 8762 TaxID=2775279 RepID=UPI00177E7772|nr:hypothetical protein [Rhizobium sp. CFBP 8762]MBD8555085.1 hypothetical protein [Rhizobium sp. CFBP 8762]